MRLAITPGAVATTGFAGGANADPADSYGGRASILGCQIDRVDLGQAVAVCEDVIQSRGRVQHIAINVAKLIAIRKDPHLRDIAARCALATADGLPIVWASRLLQDPLPSRVTGIDLMQSLLARAAAEGYRVYVLGARPENLARAVDRIVEQYPGVAIVGYRDGYFADADEDAVAAAIATTQPDILLVAMSSPRKEYFLARHAEVLDVPFVMGVGGAIDVLAGVRRRAPTLVQQLGLEWLFRLVQEPRRLARRYFSTNTLFLAVLTREVMRTRLITKVTLHGLLPQRADVGTGIAATKRRSGPNLEVLLDRTERHLELAEFRGWDPYDALCSPLFRLPVLRSNRLVRFGAQQLVRRAPWNLRPLLGIPKQLNPVAVGLYIEGESQRAMSDPDSVDVRREKVQHAIQLLVAIRSTGYSGTCWGYPFDWEGRYASLPAGTPTVVATGMITNALSTAHSVFGLDTARLLVLDAARFVMDDLNRIEAPEGDFSWSYSPLDRQAVLNATMKGSRLLAQAYAFGGPPEFRDMAARSVRFVLAHQLPSGSWPYSANDRRRWADNFHTGYVLTCLKSYRRHSGDRTVDDAMCRGWAYYRQRFFTEDMTPKYFDDRAEPLDATACAQAIITLCEFGDVRAARQVVERSVSLLALPDGSFAYQRRGNRTRKTLFLRWSAAWMYAALSHFVRTLHDESARAEADRNGDAITRHSDRAAGLRP